MSSNAMEERSGINNAATDTEQSIGKDKCVSVEQPSAPEMISVKMSVQGGGGKIGFFRSPRIHEPVHEQMTMAALINSDYRSDSSVSFYTLRDDPNRSSDLNDFIRGTLWNDDPETLLFDEEADNNLTYSTGLEWGTKFKSGEWFGGSDKKELIRRSHIGDLQWLHAMGSQMGEAPSDTKQIVLRWMETMYNVATGVLDPNTKITDTWLGGWFDNPSRYDSIGELLHQHHHSAANIPNRALGSCFHVIQDSYAVGHTRREPLNLDDRLPGHEIKYKPGVVDRWGAVLNFHTYKGQGDDHGHYDHSDVNVATIDLKNLDVWNQFIGCRDGVDACITLANYWHKKAPWIEVHGWLDTEVLKLSDKATSSDNTVAQ